MAILQSFRGHEVKIQISDDGGTTFAHPAIINTSRAISFTAETETDELVDDADQSLPAQMSRFVRSVDCKVDGAGVAQKGEMKYWMDWLLSGEQKPVKLIVDDVTATQVMILSNFQISADRAKYGEFSATLELAENGVTTATTA